MALVTLPVPILYPHGPQANPTPFALSAAATNDAAGDYFAVVTQAVENMTITHVGWRTSGISGSPTGYTQIEGVNTTTGFPDGTVLGSGNARKLSGTLAGSTWVLHPLEASATIVKGQWFAVKVLYNGGTSFQPAYGGGCRWINQNPYFVVEAGVGPVRSAATNVFPNFALGSSATTFYRIPGFAAYATAGSSVAFDNTNGNARGVYFQVPYSCRCSGLSVYLNAAIGNFNAALHTGTPSTSVELGSSSTAIYGNVSAASNGSPFSVMFDTPVVLTPGTNYRAIIEAAQSGVNTSISTYAVPLADPIYLGANPGGLNWYYTARVSGAWTESNTIIPIMDIIIDQLDDGTGSGGGGAMLSRIQGGF